MDDVSVNKPNKRESSRVLLLNPRISGEARYGKYKDVGSYLPPYGLLSIAAVLEQHGHTVMVVDADSRQGRTYDDLQPIIEDFKPDVIGMTAYSIARNQVIEVGRFIKTFTDVPIVAGGPHVITIPEDLIQFECFDVLAYGEGEFIMLELVEHYLGKRDIKDITGILYTENGETKKTEPRAYIQDLDTLPYPAFHLLEEFYDYKPMQLLYKRLPVMTVISGRGCPYGCIFCNSIWAKKVRLNSAKYVIGLVKKLMNDFGVREIMFYEDTFAIKRDRVYEICDIMEQENLDITWTCSANVRTLEEPLLKRMRQAGCWLISMGIESGSNEVLKFIHKPVTVEEVRRVCTWADNAGIRIRGFFMLGHPVDTKETINKTIQFAMSLPLHTINFCILQLMPGSKVREIAHEYGTVDYDFSLGTGHPGETLSFVPRGLTSEYLKKMQRKGYKKFFLRPKQMWRLLRSVDSFEDVRKYSRMAKAFFKLYFT